MSECQTQAANTCVYVNLMLGETVENEQGKNKSFDYFISYLFGRS